MATTNDESIGMLMSMGFSRDQSSQALIECGGHVENAINLLLSGEVGGGNANTSNTSNDIQQQHNNNDDSSSVQAVHSDISQYSDSLGRSACTMIALSMAHRFLLSNSNKNNPQSVISSIFLSDSIQEGIQLYNSIKNNSNGEEHTSVEELISACLAQDESSEAKSIIKSLQLFDSSPRQGILSNQSDNPLGLKEVLSQCQTDAIDDSYIAVVITKSPETILVLLPPASSSTICYILLDSHPRPPIMTGSYALLHPTLSSLVESIKQIFPVTDLGDGVSEMMTMMYNSFDVYPFQLRHG